MAFILIPTFLIVVSLAIVGRIVYKKIPQDREFFDNAVAKENFGPTFYEKALSSFSAKATQAAIKSSTRLIYKLKITSLKTDNFFSRLLQEMKSHRENLEIKTAESLVTEPQRKAPEKAIDFKISPVTADFSEVMPVADDLKNNLPVKSPFEAEEQQLINRLTYNPKDVSAYKRLGWLYLENSKPIQAKQSFKTAVKLGSKDKIIMAKLLEMGEALHKEGTARHTVSVSPSPVSHVNTEPVLAKSESTKLVKEPKKSQPKTKKLKVKKA